MIKKLIILALVALCNVAVAFAQTEQNDTISSVNLREVIIHAAKVVNKADMDIYYPSESTVENSSNCLQLLNHLKIPTLHVNEVFGKITKFGKAVQVRINGREATVVQVRSLMPETIKCIEWIDKPGLRYKGAVAVLNFIVINPTVGGSVMVDAMPALNMPWGEYNGALKLHSGHSQWGASINFRNTNHIGTHRDYTETFNRLDGSSVTRNEIPIDGYVSSNYGSLQLDYSYVKPDTTTLWVSIKGYNHWPNEILYNSRLTLSNKEADILLHDFSCDKGFTPSFNAYFEHHFNHGHVLAIDVNSLFYSGRTTRSYIERSSVTEDTINNVNTSIKDCNKTYGVTADYIKKWSSSSLTVGTSYTARRNRSTYESLNNNIYNQHQDELYLYGEYFQELNKFTITAGVGTQYTSLGYRETGQGKDSWRFLPKATITYRPNDVSAFDIGFSSWQTTPTLTETNIVEQQIDGFQRQKGNPYLGTSTSYDLSLHYKLNTPRVQGEFGLSAFTSPDAITPFYKWEGNKFMKSFENSDGLGSLSVWLSPSIEIIPTWLTVEGMLKFTFERMKGNGYKLYNRDWSGEVNATLTHWGFNFQVSYNHAQSGLWGETLHYGESVSLVQLQYNWRNWQFGAGVLCPFNKYDQGSNLLNKWNSNEKHIRIDMAPIPFLQVNYNVQWGRQRQKGSVEKLVNADSGIQKSSSAGR